jgi:3'(2'), 5'-bisphosphate nucleotidase
MPGSHDPLLQAAIAATAAASRVTRTVQRNPGALKRLTKDDRSPVTVADFAAQAVVALELNRALGGGVRIVGEEHAASLRLPGHEPVRDAVCAAVAVAWPGLSNDEVLDAIDSCAHDASSERFWTIDPIDGTKGFLRGEQYAVALACLEEGRVVHAAMGCPSLPADPAAPLTPPDERGVLYAASRGRGAWGYAGADPAARPHAITATPRDGRPIRVCESVERDHSSHGDTRRVLERVGELGEPVRLDSQCKYAVVARGQADAYLRFPTRRDYIEKIWDHAAGMLIATEAGAVVSDIAGAPLDFTAGTGLARNRGIICAVPGLHESLIAAIEELGIAATA